ncbi:MAG: hypothetical protein M3Q95_14285 [Bacteroidota bacterium]|nr:hypothetical protein [Bacteroidota bacterium]
MPNQTMWRNLCLLSVIHYQFPEILKMMILQIDSNKLISEIKEQFHVDFPFLKLEFFTKAHDVTDASFIKEMIKTNPELGEISRNKKCG